MSNLREGDSERKKPEGDLSNLREGDSERKKPEGVLSNLREGDSERKSQKVTCPTCVKGIASVRVRR
ncbi:hypothetical protein PsJ27TS7_34660 [Paenibacillus dendritiformis]